MIFVIVNAMSDNHLIDIIDRLSRIEQTCKDTLKQAEKTNGRVSILEEKVDSLELTRAENKGSWKIASIVATAISTAFYFTLNKILK